MGFFPPADVLLQTIGTTAQVRQRPSAALRSGCLLHWERCGSVCQPTPNPSVLGQGRVPDRVMAHLCSSIRQNGAAELKTIRQFRLN